MTSVIRNLHRARKYIELLRSGERWIDVCPATATFLPLQRGDRINIINAGSKDLELQVEVTDKRHYKSVKELIKGEDLERCLGVGASTSSLDGGSVPVDRDVKTLKVLNTRGATLAARTFEQSGIFAIHLRVVEDM
jgi:ASC-1-like (ASCH) protein